MTTPPSTPDPAPSRPLTASPSLERVERIFFEVSALSPADRDGAIARLCQGDAHLEGEVRSLVASAIHLGSYLEQPALGRPFDQLAGESNAEAPDPLVGSTLGPFTIERRIASGGMGTVYAATRTDGQFQQRVAVKVVKRGLDSEDILRRFATERQTLASLDHPNIARLLDGGLTPDGRPFVVMEYVDGVPIDQYCDQRSLSVRQRLALFLDVCAGVHHAHQNLVIHRDLKPGNILVTPQGVPKLLDFGIAKVLSGTTDIAQSPLTADTERRLTPEYASPEQVQGVPLTTASDVYSLGVILYELLTGTRPYAFGIRSSEEVRRVVCTLEPLAPSRALTVRPSRLRTDTPPDSTRPPASALTSASAPITDPALPSEPVTPKTARARGVSSTRLRSLLKGDLDTIVLMALRKEPKRRYASADQLADDLRRFQSGLPVLARRDTLVYRAGKFIRRHPLGLGATAAAIVLLSLSTAGLYRQRTELLATNGALDRSNRALVESRRFLRDTLAGAGVNGAGPDARLADLLDDALRALSAAPPTDPATRAAAQQELGRALMSLGRLDDADPLLRAAADSWSHLPLSAAERVDSEIDLGELAFLKGEYADAKARFEALLAAQPAASSANAPNAPGALARQSVLLNNLGSVARLQGRTADAITLQERALVATITAFGEKSLDAAQTRNNLASALLQAGKPAEAAEQFALALAVRQQLLRAGHPLILRCQSNLGLALLRSGKATQAEPMLAECADRWSTSFGPDHPGLVPALTAHAQALRALHKPQQAIDRLTLAVNWIQAHPQGREDQLTATRANIGLALADMGQRAEARALLEPALKALADKPAYAGVVTNIRAALRTLDENATPPAP